LWVLTLINYEYQCAFCDVIFNNILVASHIVRWKDNPLARGDLSNIICLCRFHDPLFEYGYIGLSDDYNVIKKTTTIQVVNQILVFVERFRVLSEFPSNPKYLSLHRKRTGLDYKSIY